MPEPTIISNFDAKEIALLASAVGAIIAAIFTGSVLVFNSWRDRASTDKRHLREQALKLAMEQWLHEAKAADVHMIGGSSIGLPGVPVHTEIQEYHGPPARDIHEIVFRALKFVDAFSKNEVTEANLRSFYSDPKKQKE